MGTIVAAIRFTWMVLGFIGLFMVLHVMFDWSQVEATAGFIGGGFVNIFEWFQQEF